MENFLQFSVLVIFSSLTLISNVQAAVFYDGPSNILETHQFSLSCNCSQFTYIKWRKSDPILYFESENSTLLVDGRKFSNITILSALPLHTGNYKCSYEPDDYGHNITVVVAIKLSIIRSGVLCPEESKPISNPLKGGGIAPADEPEGCVIAEPYAGNLTLQCVSDLPLPPDVTLVWVKNSSVVQANQRIKINSSPSNHLVVNFTSVLPNDAGHYQCRAVKKNEKIEDGKVSSPEKPSAIEIRVLPYVKNAFKDVSVVEEKPLSLTCIVLSTAPTTVFWTLSTFEGEFKRNYTQSHERIILNKVNSSTNAMLLIKSANLSLDRGKYECFAESSVGRSPTTTIFTVRVKSKYAALWPFLGICAEVFLLCSIILIYEKKRDKTEMEESDTDQGPEIKSSPDHGRDGMRFRK